MTFCIPKKPLSRRTMLRGMAAGALVTVGLPRLEAMLNVNGTAYAQGAPCGNCIGPAGLLPNLPRLSTRHNVGVRRRISQGNDVLYP